MHQALDCKLYGLDLKVDFSLKIIIAVTSRAWNVKRGTGSR